MTTRAWKVFGKDGHRQRISFEESVKYDWTEQEGFTRILEEINSDKTGTNEYTIIRITRDSAEECEKEFFGQLYDGVFENSRFGEIYEVNPETFEQIGEFAI